MKFMHNGYIYPSDLFTHEKNQETYKIGQIMNGGASRPSVFSSSTCLHVYDSFIQNNYLKQPMLIYMCIPKSFEISLYTLN